MSEVFEKSCLCGEVSFEVEDPESMGSCHCTRCQQWTGGQGVTVVVVAAKKLRITKGRELMKTYREEGFTGRCFCGNCGSSLYGEGGDKLYVGAGGVRGITMKPAWHIQVANKAPWDEIAGDAPQFAEWPPK